jgi:CRP-like cAMP-binding protein
MWHSLYLAGLCPSWFAFHVDCGDTAVTNVLQQRARHGNLLIERMSRNDQRVLISIGENCHLRPGEALCERGQKTEFVMFPSCGAVALVVPAHATPGLAVHLVGREGMLGIHHVLGDHQSILQAVVQTSGAALKVQAHEFASAMARSPSLRRVMHGYLCNVLEQIAVAGVHARITAIRPRLAGWLLMIRDRTSSDHFHVTQASLAQMLGVRRVSVSNAACELRRANLIEYCHGELTILDAIGLRAIARGSISSPTVAADGILTTA